MESNRRILAALAGVALMGSTAVARTLPTHPAALAAEAASETVAACARQGYRETAQVWMPTQIEFERLSPRLVR